MLYKRHFREKCICVRHSQAELRSSEVKSIWEEQVKSIQNIRVKIEKFMDNNRFFNIFIDN